MPRCFVIIISVFWVISSMAHANDSPLSAPAPSPAVPLKAPASPPAPKMASAPSPTPSPASPEAPSLVGLYRDVIIGDDALLIRALWLLRLDGHYDDALMLAAEAAALRRLSRGVIYQLALVHVASGRCDLAEAYFMDLIMGWDDRIAENSQRFMRQCARLFGYKWGFEGAFGYGSVLALSPMQQSIRPQDGSEFAQVIEDIEANLSGISLDDTLMLGMPQMGGWFADVAGRISYGALRRRGRYRGEAQIYQRKTDPPGFGQAVLGLAFDATYPQDWGLWHSRLYARRWRGEYASSYRAKIRHIAGIEQIFLIPMTPEYDVKFTLGSAFEWYPRGLEQELHEQRIRVGLFHKQHPAAHNPSNNHTKSRFHYDWHIEVSWAQDVATPAHLGAEHLALRAGAVVPLPDDSGKMRLLFGIERAELNAPRPWRRHRHHILHHSLRVIFAPTALVRHGLEIEFNAQSSRSSDAFDRRENWNLLIHYRPDLRAN